MTFKYDKYDKYDVLIVIVNHTIFSGKSVNFSTKIKIISGVFYQDKSAHEIFNTIT